MALVNQPKYTRDSHYERLRLVVDEQVAPSAGTSPLDVLVVLARIIAHRLINIEEMLTEKFGSTPMSLTGYGHLTDED